MRTFRSLRLFAAASLLATATLGCGAATTPATSASAASLQRASLEPYVLPGSKLVVHMRAGAMRDLPLFAAFEAVASKLDAGPLSAITRCGLGWQDVGELVLSGDPEGNDVLLVARTDDSRAALACLRAEQDGSVKARVAGLEAVESPDGEIAVARGDLLFAGTRARVEDALKGPPARAGAGDVLARLEGTPDSLCRVYIESSQGTPRAVAFALDGDEGSLSARIGVDLSSTTEADQLSDLARLTVDKGKSDLRAAGGGKSKDLRVLADILERVEIRRRAGGRVTVAMGVEGDGREVKDGLAAFVDFAQGTASVFARKAQADHARALLLDLAQRVAAYADGHRRQVTRFPSLPGSAPATPSAVPRGEPATVSESDWSHRTWRDLAFSLEGPLQYSFAVETARSGRVAIVRATGDLDGDGVVSVQEVAVRIDPRGVVSVDPNVTVRDVLE
jgi:hypothetical protein